MLDATRKPGEDDNNGYRKRKEAVEHEIESLNKKCVSTRGQVQTIIKKLSNAKFLMTQNKVVWFLFVVWAASHMTRPY